MLPHLACLCGNDYVDFDKDRPALHKLLSIPSEGMKLFDAIGCVVAFLSKASEHLNATLAANAADPLVVKYRQALQQYNLSMPQNRAEQKDPLVRSMLAAQSKGQVFGFALKLLGCLLNNEEVFRPALSAGPFALSPNTTNLQQAQFQALSAFTRVRARLCDVVLGPGRTVEEEINAADGLIIYRRVTKDLPPEGKKSCNAQSLNSIFSCERLWHALAFVDDWRAGFGLRSCQVSWANLWARVAVYYFGPPSAVKSRAPDATREVFHPQASQPDETIRSFPVGACCHIATWPGHCGPSWWAEYLSRLGLYHGSERLPCGRDVRAVLDALCRCEHRERISDRKPFRTTIPPV